MSEVKFERSARARLQVRMTPEDEYMLGEYLVLTLGLGC